MQKLSDKSFSRKVVPFLVVCMVLLLYVWGVSTIVTGEADKTDGEGACNTEAEHKAVSIPRNQLWLMEEWQAMINS